MKFFRNTVFLPNLLVVVMGAMVFNVSFTFLESEFNFASKPKAIEAMILLISDVDVEEEGKDTGEKISDTVVHLIPTSHRIFTNTDACQYCEERIHCATSSHNTACTPPPELRQHV